MYNSIRLKARKFRSRKKNSLPRTRKTNSLESVSSPTDQILFLQRTIGNQAVQGLFESGVIQAKLRVGQPGDQYEQEADRVADQVMRMPDPKVQAKPT